MTFSGRDPATGWAAPAAEEERRRANEDAANVRHHAERDVDGARARGGRRQTRTISWLIGIALGLFAGGAVLVAGVLALLLLVPACVWAAREKARPIGLGGLVTGLGAGMAGLLAFAAGRCAAQVSGPSLYSECVAPDLTPWFAAAAVFTAIGIVVSLLGGARDRPPTG